MSEMILMRKTMATRKVNTEYKKLVSLFNDLTGSRSLWNVFNDCIEMFALSIQNTCSFDNFQKRETRYKDIAKNYSKSEFDIILQIFAEIVNKIEENPFRDYLGNLYMQLNMGSDALGQFFTPYAVSYAMAEAVFDDKKARDRIEKNGYIKLYEPCVGGGANVIAFCEALKNHGYNYQKQCIVVCQELSCLTAMMCYTALSLMGCAAVIKIGDTLSEPYTNYCNEKKKKSELWTTPLFCVNNCYAKV